MHNDVKLCGQVTIATVDIDDERNQGLVREIAPLGFPSTIAYWRGSPLAGTAELTSESMRSDEIVAGLLSLQRQLLARDWQRRVRAAGAGAATGEIATA
mmetsp:Transcript_36383/g.121828  ORF Transcript_36383/g.121828 Transcript_36383/m.121828 type:complete len:99 (+) Transcript_36383:1102-1398(+)